MKKSYYHMKYANYYPKLLLWQHNMKKQMSIFKPKSLEKVSCHFLMNAIRKTALYMLDS